MSKYTIDFYNDATGVSFSMRWPSREHYLAAIAFLDTLIGKGAGTDQRGRAMYPLWTEDDRNALYAFRRQQFREWRSSDR